MPGLDISACLGRTRYTEKDTAKAEAATRFIGRGSARSSTNAYRLVIGPERANSGSYSANDVVWISAEGDRRGRVAIDVHEITLATSVGATILTDTLAHRTRPYNLGERDVAQLLAQQGYAEIAPGRWRPRSV